MCDNFGTIIKQSNLLFNVNERTEYLLIVGSKVGPKKLEEKEFIRNMQAFNWSGQRTLKFRLLEYYMCILSRQGLFFWAVFVSPLQLRWRGAGG
jgi:hypothetical protein